jgi:uncharacterized membrane protein YfcA
MSPLVGLLGALFGFTVFYLTAWWRGSAQAASTKGAPREAVPAGPPNGSQLGLGFVTNFFDTLGIGSFAPTTAMFKFLRMVPDRLIPGTLNVGHTLPTIVQAFIYTLAVDVDVKTLILMIGAAVAGAWLGAGIVATWPKRRVQVGMGIALLVAAGLFTRAQLTSAAEPLVDGDGQAGASLRTKDWRPNMLVLPAGSVFTIEGVHSVDGTGRDTGRLAQFTASADVTSDANGGATIPISPAVVVGGAGATVTIAPPNEKAVDVGRLDLQGVKLALGLAGNFLLGALMTLGIGLYAPCMILVGLLGMNARAAFPIMMGSCAFLMPVSSAQFVQKQAYSHRAALGLAIGGVPAVLIAAYIVKSLPLYWVKWLVVVVVLIASTMMLRSAAKNE